MERELILVSRENFYECVAKIKESTYRSFDTETTGLHPHLGAVPFSMSISTPSSDYYFNWLDYSDSNMPLLKELVLEEIHWSLLGSLFDKGLWFAHNALFDISMLRTKNIRPQGAIYCTMVGERLLFNEYFKGRPYSLDSCGNRRGYRKDDKVMEYIKNHNFYDKKKSPQFYKVPYPIISKYAALDSFITLEIGMDQVTKLKDFRQSNPHLPNPSDCLNNEIKLTGVLAEMKEVGIKVDTDATLESLDTIQKKRNLLLEEFENIGGRPFTDSSKELFLFFYDEKENFTKTKTGNLSFDKKALALFANKEKVDLVINIRKTKTLIDFLHTILEKKSEKDTLHTDFLSAGTRTGRFSSRDPNLQNLPKNRGENDPFTPLIRRSFIPRNGYFFAMIDYDQIEYRLLLEYCGAKDLIEKVLSGLDVHSATAELAGCSRFQAKTVNFLTVYGGGVRLLASELGTTVEKAKEIQNSIFNAAPEIKAFIDACEKTARTREFLVTWNGRISRFPRAMNKSRLATNTIIQGSAADVVKVAMVECVSNFLKDKKSRLLLNIHDELIFEVHESERGIISELKRIMEEAYPYKKLPLTCGVDISMKNLHDKEPWVE